VTDNLITQPLLTHRRPDGPLEQNPALAAQLDETLDYLTAHTHTPPTNSCRRPGGLAGAGPCARSPGTGARRAADPGRAAGAAPAAPVAPGGQPGAARAEPGSGAGAGAAGAGAGAEPSARAGGAGGAGRAQPAPHPPAPPAAGGGAAL